jgi:Domain of unknown function (DUF4249)
MKALIKLFVPVTLLMMLLIGCEKEFTPIVNNEEEIVVEGYIEAGRNATPPYVILTKSIPFFKELKGLNDLFVKGAEVWVSSGKDSVRLSELCWTDLDPAFKKQAAVTFGIDLDSVSKDFNFCVYLDITNRIKVEVGKSYALRIKTKEGKLLTATTFIPRTVKIDSAQFIKPPGTNQNDTMAQMRAIITEPAGPDFYRYFTSTNSGSYIAGSQSVTDDGFFDGIVAKFNLLKSEPRNSETKPELFGLFKRGDTVSIKFCTIDKAHFNFWSTLEANANNGGPFGTYTRVRFNVDGGLGIWGGYNATYFDVIVPKK